MIRPFKDEKEAILAYDNHEVSLQEIIRVRRTLEFDGVPETRMVQTTVGRIIFNEAIPQNLGYVDRTNEETKFDYEISFLVDKKAIGKVINKCINRCGATAVSYTHLVAIEYSTGGNKFQQKVLKLAAFTGKMPCKMRKEMWFLFRLYKSGALRCEFCNGRNRIF